MRRSQLNVSWLPGLLVSFILVAISIPASMDLPDSTRNRSIKHDGKQRSYLQYAPELEFEEGKRPLLIVLHGGGGTGRSIVRLTEGRFNELAESNGFVVVYPDGVKRYWNEGRKKSVSYAHKNNVDDVGFIEALIEAVKQEYAIDEQRIFVAGMSNGGLMAYRLACEMPGVFKAIAPVTASIPLDIIDRCDNIAGSSLLVMNGTEDPFMPYDGGTIKAGRKKSGEVLSTDATIAHWLEQNGCPSHAKKTILPDIAPKDGTSVIKYEYGGCPTDVRVLLYKVEGGGHTWPGGRQYLKEERVGKTSQDFMGADVIWDFFQMF